MSQPLIVESRKRCYPTLLYFCQITVSLGELKQLFFRLSKNLINSTTNAIRVTTNVPNSNISCNASATDTKASPFYQDMRIRVNKIYS